MTLFCLILTGTGTHTTPGPSKPTGITFVTARKQSCGKVLFLHLSFCSQVGLTYHNVMGQASPTGPGRRYPLHPGGRLPPLLRM